MAKVLFNPLTAALGGFALIVSFFLPTEGLGVTMCWFKWLSGLPCPGCGLTRSVTCISQGQFSKAVAFHPFGPLVYALFVANVLMLGVSAAKRESIKAKIAAADRWLRPVYMTIVAAFLAFGVGRIVYMLVAMG